MKKVGILTFLMMAVVTLALVFSVGAVGPKASAAPAPAVAAVPAPAAAVAPPDHPHIHDALEAMHTARHHLESAEHDFDGHRQKALQHLDAAIHEAEICQGMR